MNSATPLIEQFENTLAMCRRSAPDLVPLRAALLPFEDVIHTWWVSPRGKWALASDEPHFTVGTYAHDDPNDTVWFEFHRGRVTVWCSFRTPEGDEIRDPPVEISLDGVFGYLRQLPRPFRSFVAGNKQCSPVRGEDISGCGAPK
jgi:hypothetical protein